MKACGWTVCSRVHLPRVIYHSMGHYGVKETGGQAKPTFHARQRRKTAKRRERTIRLSTVFLSRFQCSFSYAHYSLPEPYTPPR